MSEYEIAALALAEEEAIRDAIGIMQTYFALLLETNIMFVSIFSGYLAIVHFLGAKLTNVQVIGVSVFYILMILANRVTFYTFTYNVNDAIQRISILSGGEFPITGGIAELSLFVTGSMIIASLFYMWSERRKQ